MAVSWGAAGARLTRAAGFPGRPSHIRRKLALSAHQSPRPVTTSRLDPTVAARWNKPAMVASNCSAPPPAALSIRRRSVIRLVDPQVIVVQRRARAGQDHHRRRLTSPLNTAAANFGWNVPEQLAIAAAN